ncbi:hypothetical protein UPYG_G00120520 [Umbra pygmaea]|uniref:DNA-repair protein Xrcc1 N-terminal domain-containing protein n=1 Tax=Umbra pygmaea TaxID=75934 RepID=A0ABD0XSD2_UMBPY
MAPVKIKHVVSFTSQDHVYSVENLWDEDGDSKPWLCNPQDRTGVLRAELQLERAMCFGYIDVGNCGSAFIQIDVGRSSWPLDQPYVTLLPTTTLMSPAESRQGTGRTGVRMFKKADFLPEGADDSWDRVKVTCSQPFNKRCQFGLSFLLIRSPQEEASTHTGKEDQGQTTPEKTASGVREWLSSPAVQRTFFARVQGEGVGLSRTARMVLTASQGSMRSFPSTSSSPQHKSSSGTQNTTAQNHPRAITLPSLRARLAPSNPNKGNSLRNTGNIHPHTASMACLGTAYSSKIDTPKRQLKREQSSQSRQNELNGTTSAKHRKPAVIKEPTSTPESPEPPGDLETPCPICGVFFPAEYLPFHASTCQEVQTTMLPGAVVTPVPGPPFSPEESMLPCPLCSFRFPPSQIQMHASSCGDAVDSDFIWVD